MNPFKVPFFKRDLETRCAVLWIAKSHQGHFHQTPPCDLGKTGRLPNGSGFEAWTAIASRSLSCLCNLFASALCALCSLTVHSFAAAACLLALAKMAFQTALRPCLETSRLLLGMLFGQHESVGYETFLLHLTQTKGNPPAEPRLPGCTCNPVPACFAWMLAMALNLGPRRSLVFRLARAVSLACTSGSECRPACWMASWARGTSTEKTASQ